MNNFKVFLSFLKTLICFELSGKYLFLLDILFAF